MAELSQVDFNSIQKTGKLANGQSPSAAQKAEYEAMCASLTKAISGQGQKPAVIGDSFSKTTKDGKTTVQSSDAFYTSDAIVAKKAKELAELYKKNTATSEKALDNFYDGARRIVADSKSPEVMECIVPSAKKYDNKIDARENKDASDLNITMEYLIESNDPEIKALAKAANPMKKTGLTPDEVKARYELITRISSWQPGQIENAQKAQKAIAKAESQGMSHEDAVKSQMGITLDDHGFPIVPEGQPIIVPAKYATKEDKTVIENEAKPVTITLKKSTEPTPDFFEDGYAEEMRLGTSFGRKGAVVLVPAPDRENSPSIHSTFQETDPNTVFPLDALSAVDELDGKSEYIYTAHTDNLKKAMGGKTLVSIAEIEKIVQKTRPDYKYSRMSEEEKKKWAIDLDALDKAEAAQCNAIGPDGMYHMDESDPRFNLRKKIFITDFFVPVK